MRKTVRKKSHLPMYLAVGGVGLAVALAALVYVEENRLRSGHAPVVHPTGRSDASEVLDPARFKDQGQRRAYAVARQIPATLNQLYCWCGCKEHSGHRALLECFESEHGSQCDICMGEAMLAYLVVQQGVTDVRKIQDAIDATYAPGRRRT